MTAPSSDPRFPGYNTTCAVSPIPPRSERGGEQKYSTPVHGREEILQVVLNERPASEQPGTFFECVDCLSKDHERRATCIGNPDPLQTPTPSDDKCKTASPLSLNELLRKKLPSPAVFANEVSWSDTASISATQTFSTAAYRSKYHKVEIVEKASGIPNIAFADKPLKARVAQYRRNKETIEAALKRRSKSSYRPAAALRCICDAPVEAEFQNQVLQRWELERDIERLEALSCNIKRTRERLAALPLLSSYFIRRTRGKRETLALDFGITEECASLVEEEEGSTNDSVSSRQVHHDKAYESLNGEYQCHIGGTNTLTASNGQPFRFDEAGWPRDMAIPDSSSAYSDLRSPTGSIGMTKRPGCVQQDHVAACSAAAHEIVRRLPSVSRSTHRLDMTSDRVSVDSRIQGSARSAEVLRGTRSAVRSPALYEGERFPKWQNVAQH